MTTARQGGANPVQMAMHANTHARALLALTDAQKRDTLAMNESHVAARTALAEEQKLATGLSLVGMAANITTVAITGFTAVVAGMVTATATAATELDALHNVEQTFGSNTASIEKAVDQQAEAYGRARGEMLAYVDTVGRELQTLGVHERDSARTATEVMQAVSMLAASRRISATAAFREIQTGGGLYSPTQIRAYAFQHNRITVRNAAIDEGTEKMIRYELAAEEILGRTEALTSADASWTNQLAALSGNLTNLQSDIGKQFTPALVDLVSWMNKAIQATDRWLKATQTFRMGMALVMGNKDEAERIAGEVFGKALGGAPIPPEQNAIDARNAQQNAIDRRRQLIGQAMGEGGGGGGGGYQGGIAGYHRAIQEAAFNLRQMQLFQLQLTAQEKANKWLETIAAKLGAKAPAPAAPSAAPTRP